jgi:hypothetical protein
MKRYRLGPRGLALCASAALAGALCASCGTTLALSVRSDPPGALVTVHATEDIESRDVYGMMPDPDKPETTPVEKKVFVGSKATEYLVLEKRGYRPAVLPITAESPAGVDAKLERIEGVREAGAAYGTDALRGGSFIFLPIDGRVVVHSGVGRLDKKTFSEELTAKADAGLADELRKAVAAADSSGERLALALEEEAAAWSACAEDAKKYLAALDPGRLHFLAYPPEIAAAVPGAEPFFRALGGRRREGGAASGPLLCFIRAQCVTETAGRKVGNFMLSIAGAAVSGVSSAYVYDPSAFEPDSGTLCAFYVVDPSSSEVLLIRRFSTGYDITRDKELKALVTGIIKSFAPAPER